MFTNQNVKTINVDDIGRVTVNVRWTASMLDKRRGMEWLRDVWQRRPDHETVNAMTLSVVRQSRNARRQAAPGSSFQSWHCPAYLHHQGVIGP